MFLNLSPLSGATNVEILAADFGRVDVVIVTAVQSRPAKSVLWILKLHLTLAPLVSTVNKGSGFLP
jgi:hypothetical protein